MPTDWHADFQFTMNSGVALVSYDCKALRLLKRCHLEGSYAFAGVDRLSNVIHMEDSTEIGASVPLPMGGKLGASLDRSSGLDVAYVLVGKRSTAAIVTRPQLKGDECAAATHFVGAAKVGAFAVKTATKGSGSAAASVFGASASAATSSGKQTAKQIGEPSACDASQSDAKSPPSNCGSAFRIELVPITDGAVASSDAAPSNVAPSAPAPAAPAPGDAAPATPAPGSPAPSDSATTGAVDPPANGSSSCGPSGASKAASPKAEREVTVLHDPCPKGFKLIADKCAKAGAGAAPHLCSPGDRDDCETQCQAGNVGSCYNLAALARDNYGKGRRPEAEETVNEKRALELDKRACDGGSADACGDYGYYCPQKEWSGTCPDSEAVTFLKKGCSMGSSNACEVLGDSYITGVEQSEGAYIFGLSKDLKVGMTFLRRACDLGDHSSCWSLGSYYLLGTYGGRDVAAGDKLLSDFCAQGDMRACSVLANSLLGIGYLEDGKMRPITEIADFLPRGRALLAKTCKGGITDDCTGLGEHLAAATDPDARAMLVTRCPDDKQASADCGYLGASLFDGHGGPADKKRGVEMMARSAVQPLVLRAALVLKKGDGVKKDTKRSGQMLKKLCSDGQYQDACDAQKGVKSAPQGGGGD